MELIDQLLLSSRLNGVFLLGIDLVALAIALLVLKSNRKDQVNKYFFILTCLFLFWINGGYFFTFSSDLNTATSLGRIILGEAIISFIFLYFFLVAFLGEKKQKNKYEKTFLALIGASFLLITTLTNFIVESVSFTEWGVNPVFSSFGGIVYYFAVFIVMAFSFYKMQSRFKLLSGSEKMKAKYFLVGISFFLLMNLAFNVALPAITGSIKYWQLGNYSAVIFLAFTAYAVVKHRLMDIRLLIARSFAFLLLLVAVAALAGGLMMVVPNYLIPSEILDKYNIAIRSGLGIILVFLFQPIKAWITHVTDRIFFKKEYKLHDLLKKITDNAYSTLILIELLYKTIDILIKDMKVTKGMFVLLDPMGEIHTTQAIGYQMTPELKVNDIKGLSKHGILFYDDLEESSHIKRLLKRADAAVCVGLLNQEKPVGILLIGDKSSGDMFNKRDFQFLEIFAPQMMVAIQRAEEHEKVQNFNVYLQAEIARKTKELQEANEHLRELDKAKDEFISMASHQLRTPLTAIKGYLSMLMEGDAGDLKMGQYDFVNEAFEGANRMVSLINDLLNVSRMDTGRFFLEPVDVDLDRMVNEEIKQLNQAAKEKKLYLKSTKKKSISKVKADSTKIRQVIMNFIDNAIYYTDKGGVTIVLDSDKDNVIFKVEDTGMGVPEVDKDRMFTKFYRADNARRVRPDGTGLGIYLAKKVIEDHGGEIIFDSVEGKGSTFGFKLPIKSKIKKEITIPPTDLQAKAEGIGSGAGIARV